MFRDNWKSQNVQESVRKKTKLILLFVGLPLLLNFCLGVHASIANPRMENLAQEKYIEMMLEVEDAGGTAEMSEISISYGYIEVKGVMQVPREVFDRWEDRYWIYHSALIHVTEKGELTVFTVPIVPVENDLKSDIDVEVTIVTPPYPMTLMNLFDFVH